MYIVRMGTAVSRQLIKIVLVLICEAIAKFAKIHAP